MTVKMPCTCQHEAQDKFYGQGIRVFNLMKPKAPGDRPAKCSVCGAIKRAKEE